MKLSTLLEKLNEYSITVLACKAKTWPAKFMIGAGTVAMAKKAEDFIRATELVDEEHNVDIPTLHHLVDAGFKAAGHVDLFGGILGFDPSDAEEFFIWIDRYT